MTDRVALVAGRAHEVVSWYVDEVPSLTDEVGVAGAEKLAATAPRGRAPR